MIQCGKHRCSPITALLSYPTLVGTTSLSSMTSNTSISFSILCTTGLDNVLSFKDYGSFKSIKNIWITIGHWIKHFIVALKLSSFPLFSLWAIKGGSCWCHKNSMWYRPICCNVACLLVNGMTICTLMMITTPELSLKKS